MPIDERFLDPDEDIEAQSEAIRGYRFIAEAASDAILTIDERSTIVFANPAVETVFGHPAGELLGEKLTVLMPETSRSAHEAAMERYLASGERRFEWSGVQLTGLHKAGHEIHLEASFGEMVRDGKRYFVGVVRDVTMRVDSERARLDAERVAREEAESANRIKDEFITVLSHELRTPLNAILGWAAFLHREFDPGKMDKALASIERNAQVQVKLVEDLLDVSRIVSGKLTLSLESVPLAALIDSVMETARPAAKAKDILLDWECSRSPVVRGDPERLRQILWNLLSNAIKFTPPKGRVSVKCGKEGSHGVLTVADTGEGISENFLSHIFERFRQADSGHRRRHGGLGLGLSIVRYLVDAHGGEIYATSSPGNGSVFSVRLPLSSAQARTSAVSPAALDDVRILVVDDHRDELELFETVLGAYGAKVTVTTSVAGALGAIGAVTPDVIVSDIAMPGRDGYDMIRAVRTGAATAAIPALALTAHARPEDREHALKAGFDDFLAKPVQPEQLVRALAMLIPREKRHADP